MMPAREPQPGRQIGVPGEGDSRWEAIWQLVLQAEQLPAGERSAFMQSAETDPFIIRQAVAILEGSESLATAAASLPLATEERFVPQAGMKIGRYRVGTLMGSGGAGSVYAAFGSKRALFLAALDRHVAVAVDAHARVVGDEGTSPAIAIRRWLKLMAAQSRRARADAGFLDASALPVALPSDITVDSRIRRGISEIERTYQRAIIRGQRLGEFDRRLNAADAAHHLLVCAQGLIVLGRITQPRSIDRTISLALAALLPK